MGSLSPYVAPLGSTFRNGIRSFLQLNC